MSSITDAIIQLERFAGQQDIVAVINRLNQLEMGEGGVEEIIGSLRNDLMVVVSNSQREELKSAAYGALLALAETYPINDQDPITLDPIRKEKRVVVSTGYQFDLEELISYHNNRDSRTTEEFIGDKKLINPLTNQSFSSDDDRHIRAEAAKRKIPVRDMQISLTSQEVSAPAFQANRTAFFQPTVSRGVVLNGETLVAVRSYADLDAEDAELRILLDAVFFHARGQDLNLTSIMLGQNHDGYDGYAAIGSSAAYHPILITRPGSFQIERTLPQYGEGVNAMVQLSDGNIAVAGSAFDANIRIINITTGELIMRISQHGESVNAITQLSDGNIAVAGSAATASIRIINIATGELIKRISQDNEGVDAMIRLPTGNIAVGRNIPGSAVRIINIDTGDIEDVISQRWGSSTSIRSAHTLEHIIRREQRGEAEPRIIS